MTEYKHPEWIIADCADNFRLFSNAAYGAIEKGSDDNMLHTLRAILTLADQDHRKLQRIVDLFESGGAAAYEGDSADRAKKAFRRLSKEEAEAFVVWANRQLTSTPDAYKDSEA